MVKKISKLKRKEAMKAKMEYDRKTKELLTATYFGGMTEYLRREKINELKALRKKFEKVI